MLAFTERGKKVTNHSVRKTCISRLLDADVPENFVAQLSGHKSKLVFFPKNRTGSLSIHRVVEIINRYLFDKDDTCTCC